MPDSPESPGHPDDHLDTSQEPRAGIDPAVPSPARMYNYFLGGRDNFPADPNAPLYPPAQTMLERSQKIQTAGGGAPSISLQLQLAGIYLQRNNTAQAYAIYQQVLAANPDRVDAWKGLIATLMATNRNSEAIQEIAVIPVPVRRQLEQDIEFIQSESLFKSHYIVKPFEFMVLHLIRAYNKSLFILRQGKALC